MLLAGITLVAGVLAAAPGIAAPAATATSTPTSTSAASATTVPGTPLPSSSLSPTTTSCQLPPSPSGDVPGKPVKTFTFEDGTTQSWSGSGGVTVTNSTEVAESGTRSLRVDGLTASNAARVYVTGLGGYGWYQATAKVRIGANGPETRMALRPVYGQGTRVGSGQVTSAGWTGLTSYVQPYTMYWDTYCNGTMTGGQRPADIALELAIDQTTCGPASGPLASTVFIDSVEVTPYTLTTPSPGSTPTPVITGGPTPTPTTDPCPGSPTPTTPTPSLCTVHYGDGNPWPGAHLVTVTIDNLSTVDKPGWTLSWDFGDDQKITNIWTVTYEQTGRHLVVHSMPYAPLRAKSSVTFGFIATDPGGLTRPGNVQLDARTCTLV